MRVSKTKKYAFSVFITLLISTMSLSILAFAADPRTLLPEVQEIIVKKTWHGEMVQNVEYTLLKWLAYVVDYISEAVDQVLNFNLYNVIKDVFNIDTIIYPIAWALAGMTVVLIGILIIVNADKIHITDYVRNILTSLFFLIALPILVSSFSDLKTVGVQFAKDNTTKDTATNRTIGEYILASNIYNVNSSINQNKLVKQSQVSSFGVNPNTVYSMNINLGLDPSKTQYRTVTTADHYDVTPTYRFDDLTFEHKLELLDLVDDYAFWQQRVAWAQANAGVQDNSDTIIGYNTQFDIGFLKANGAIVPDDLETVDVMEDFAKIYGEWNSARGSYKWQKLTRAAEYYGYDWSQRAETAHNSLGDCYATLFVYDKINTDTMVIERVIDGKRVGIELTPAEISQAYYIKENDDRRQDILNALDEMDSLKIGNIDISNDFLKKSTTFINDVIYRYEKMDDHLEDYNMAIEDVLDNADKNYANKLVSHYAQNMSAADKEQYIESAEMAMDWNDTNEPAISRLEYMLYTTLITERDYDKIKQDCLKAPKNKTGEYIDEIIKTMRTEAKVYFIEGIDEDRKNGVEISELDNIVYDKLVEDRLIRENARNFSGFLDNQEQDEALDMTGQNRGLGR